MNDNKYNLEKNMQYVQNLEFGKTVDRATASTGKIFLKVFDL